MTEKRHQRLALVCTPGGHYEQMLNLTELYRGYPHFWITAHSLQTDPAAETERVHFINIAHFKKPWTYLLQLPALLRVFLAERPTHVISTGSGRIVFLPYLISRALGMTFLHIETYSHVHGLTKMGRFLTRLGTPVYSQWKSDEENRIIYIGPIIAGDPAPPERPSKPNLVFVSVGTRSEPFPRMIRAVEKLIEDGIITGRVVVQAGHTRHASSAMDMFDYCPPDRIDRLIAQSAFVITQESAGLVTKCLKWKVPFIVMPRDYAHGELPARSDMREDLHLKLAEMGLTYVVRNAEEMRTAIANLDKLKEIPPFDNSRAIATLRKLIDGDGR